MVVVECVFLDTIMSSAPFESLAGEQVLHLTTVGRVTGRPREIEIWFILCCDKFYLFSEQGEASGWVKNIRRSPNVSVRIGERRIKAVAKVLDYRTDRQLWDQVQAIADRKYRWGDGLPVEVAPLA
jgi:deazaflavin-dependent oxidoreductase (nitroreductase family)